MLMDVVFLPRHFKQVQMQVRLQTAAVSFPSATIKILSPCFNIYMKAFASSAFTVCTVVHLHLNTSRRTELTNSASAPDQPVVYEANPGLGSAPQKAGSHPFLHIASEL